MSTVELGTESESHASTFVLTDEDHTLGNSLRYVLNQDPRVEFCGYSVPHPSENKVNVRVQTTGAPAKEVFKDSLQNLMAMCEHVRTTFDKAIEKHKMVQNLEQDISMTHTSGVTGTTS